MNALYERTMEALEASLQCAIIASEIDFSAGVFSPDSADRVVSDYAKSNRFTQVALGRSTASEGHTVTDVALIDPETWGVIERRSIAPSDLLSASTPIGRVIGLLKTRPFFFLLENDRITRILTRADLNRLPVRTYLHTLLDHLEAMFVEIIVAYHGNDGWMRLLSPDTKERIRQLQRDKIQEDFDSRLIDCTMFTDKVNILRKTGDPLLDKLGCRSKSAAKKRFEAVRALRDRLSHGLAPFEQDLDRLRNHLRHGDQLTKVRDIDWLGAIVEDVENWISAFQGSVE